MALSWAFGETSRPASIISGERVGLGVRSKTHDEVVEGGRIDGKVQHEGVDCYGRGTRSKTRPTRSGSPGQGLCTRILVFCMSFRASVVSAHKVRNRVRVTRRRQC